MTTWVFEGTVLPAGQPARLEFGSGDADPCGHPAVLATLAAVILNHRRIS